MTNRNPNLKTEFQGVRFVQGIVQDNHSIFQNLSRENDQGNDCYIEFVRNGIATNYGIFVQIKSGDSYKDNIGYKFTADNAHLNYWKQGLNLTVGIVFDPEINKAFWVDVTSYLTSKPDIFTQSYHNIRVDKANEFSEDTFSEFMEYCFSFRQIFSSYEKFGRALEWFSNIDDSNICYEGMKSLYCYHREKPATWFYIISNFSRIDEEGIRKNILGLLSNYVNRDIFWHSNNLQYLPSLDQKDYLTNLMTKYFRRIEIEITLSYLETGIVRGSFNYLIFLVINMVADLHEILKDIAFNAPIDEEKRNFCFWLYMHTAKFHSINDTLKTIDTYLVKFPFGMEDETLIGVKEGIEKGELWPIG